MLELAKFEAIFLDEQTADVHFVFKTNAAELPDEDGFDEQKAIDDVKPANESVVSEDIKRGVRKMIESLKTIATTQKPAPFKRIPAHKILLATASPVFHAMFFGPMKEAATVEIKDVSSEAFKEFLQFVYVKAPRLSLEFVGDVLYMADKYDMAKCTAYCYTFLESCIDAEQVLTIYELSVHFENQAIIKKCERVIASNASTVLVADALLGTSRKVLKSVMALNGLSQQQKFKACMEWSHNECSRNGSDPNDMRARRSAIGDCFELIKFNDMRRAELLECIEQHGKLFDFKELSDLFAVILRKCKY